MRSSASAEKPAKMPMSFSDCCGCVLCESAIASPRACTCSKRAKHKPGDGKSARGKIARPRAKRLHASHFYGVQMSQRDSRRRHDHHQKLKMVLGTQIKGDRHDPLEDTESSLILLRVETGPMRKQ